MKPKIRKISKALDSWLFEISDAQLAGNLDSEEKEELPQSQPIMPLDQMAMQLTQEKPPIEDVEWKPATLRDLAAAADQIASQVPEDQIEFFYSEIQKLKDRAFDLSREKELNDPVYEPEQIKSQISVRQERKMK